MMMIADKEKLGGDGGGHRQESALSPVRVETVPAPVRHPAKLFLRVFTRELWREITARTKTVTFIIAVLLTGAVFFLGYLAYKERKQSLGLIGSQSRVLQDQGKKIDEQSAGLVSLKEQLEKSNRQPFDLSQTEHDIYNQLTQAPKLWSAYGNGVCLIAGSYILIDPATGKPLRYPENNDEGSQSERLLTEGTKTPLVPTGNGRIFELEFVGTGFHVGDGYILTNRHIAAQPWMGDARAAYLLPMTGARPRVHRLLAFFPGRDAPYRLAFKKTAQEVDLAVCVIDGKWSAADIPVLPLDRDSDAVAVGKAVVMMGYPSGPHRMLALLPEAEAMGLQNKYGESLVTLLDQLAKRKLVKPLTTQGHITDLYTNRIAFDAATAQGASGTPMFGQSGRVIGVTFAIFLENSGTNFAVPITGGITLLESAGWREKTAE